METTLIPARHAARFGWPLPPLAGGDGEGDPAGGGGSGGGSGGGGDDKRFTQADVDRVVGERLARERQQAAEKYADYDDLKAKATKLAELEGQNQTAAEKAQADLEAAREEARKAREAGETASSQAKSTIIESKVIVEAAKAGAADPEDVYAVFARKHNGKLALGDDGQVTVSTTGDDGQEKKLSVGEAITSLLEEKKHLVGTRRPGPGDGGARPPAETGDLDQQIAEASKKGDWATVNSLNAQKLAALHNKE